MNTPTEPSASVLWRRRDLPGHEVCRIQNAHGAWHLSGAAVFMHQDQACQLVYAVDCDALWITQSARVTGWVGNQAIDVQLARSACGQWRLNGLPVDAVAACSDIDLNFSPSTNTLPIRRLNLQIGDSAEVRAAWLRFSSFSLEPLVQTYTRLDRERYRYASAGGSFVADISTDAQGLALDYGDIWSRVP